MVCLSTVEPLDRRKSGRICNKEQRTRSKARHRMTSHASFNRDARIGQCTKAARDNADTVDSLGVFPSSAIESIRQSGMLALCIPQTYGGMGGSALEFSSFVRALGRECASTALIYVMHATGLQALLFCSSHHAVTYLQNVVRGACLITTAISEAGSGSQWWKPKSNVRESDGVLEMTADKSWVTSAGFADLYVVSAQLQRTRGTASAAIFAVPASLGGIEVGQWSGLGVRGSSSAPLRVRCTLPPDSVLFASEDLNAIEKFDMANQPIFHLGLASCYTGVAEAAFQECLSQVRRRQYDDDLAGFGRDQRNYPVTQIGIGEMSYLLFTMKSSATALAEAIDRCVDSQQLAHHMTACKVAISRGVIEITKLALQTAGGVAYRLDRGVRIERFLRDAMAMPVMAPTDSFCLNMLGKLSLGLGTYHELLGSPLQHDAR